MYKVFYRKQYIYEEKTKIILVSRQIKYIVEKS